MQVDLVLQLLLGICDCKTPFASQAYLLDTDTIPTVKHQQLQMLGYNPGLQVCLSLQIPSNRLK